jgi:glycosyltransferase involved in cell wall biosynthesis
MSVSPARMTARAPQLPQERVSVPPDRLRVLLVPDSIHWITGTIAKSIVEHNVWIDGTIMSGAVLDVIAREHAEIFSSFDLVHFVCPYASKRWLPVLRNKLPCVTSHHHVSDDWELQRHNLDGDAIIVGSSQWAEDAESRGADPSKIVRVPYGVDASRFVPPTTQARDAARASLGIAADAILLGFFAKLSSNEQDRKGTDIFAAAVRALNTQLANLTVLIIGPGWDELVAQLRSASVRCVWLPFVKDADRMPEMYQALDFYWVTARVEGGPVTLLEAMSTGVCCITTPVGLARDIVETGVNALMAPFDNVAAFTERTRNLAHDPEMRATIGVNARKTILEFMDVQVTSLSVCDAYTVALEYFRNRTVSCQAPRSLTTVGESILEQVAVLEELVWAEALILQGQRALALRIMATTWAKYPLSSRPARYFFRNVLPQEVVRALVRLAAPLRRSK